MVSQKHCVEVKIQYKTCIYLSCCYLIIPNTSVITLIEHFICKSLGVGICKLLVFVAKYILCEAFSPIAGSPTPWSVPVLFHFVL